MWQNDGMKAVSLCLTGLLACAVTLSAQDPLEKRLSAKIQPGPKQFGEISEADKKLVIRKVTQVLRKHVTFRGEGVVATYFDGPTGRQHVEWLDLRIKMLVPVRISESDKKLGM